MMVPGKAESEPGQKWIGKVPDDRKVQEATRKEDELLSLVAHELRGPLGAIRLALEVLRRGGEDDPATRTWAQNVVDRQTCRMGSLIEKLLEFSRIRRGKTPLRKQRVDLARVVNAAIETVQPGIEEQGHALKITLPPGPMPLEVDPTMLEQVLTNLLGNAAKYTDRGGQIWLTALPEGNDIVLRVRDNGIGIAADVLPQIFDLFCQASRTADHSAGGLGLGLALVRQIVELHGGSVSASSPGPGQGSEFVVRLPQPPEMNPAILERCLRNYQEPANGD